jgi:signal transduction histidine kinase
MRVQAIRARARVARRSSADLARHERGIALLRMDATTARSPHASLGLERGFWGRLWVRVAIQGALVVAVVFGVYEIAERTFLVDASPWTLHALHIARGMGTAFLLATWSFVEIRKARLARDRRLQDDIEQLAARLRHQEKMASLGALAAGFAHDLGNPLASLSTELELLEGETDASRMHESLGVLRQHVARMSRTLREMVDFARRRHEEATWVSVARAVADAERLVAHDPRWRRVRFTVAVPSDLPPVHIVEDYLVLVLVNLMINAADAMPNGGALTITAREGGDRVSLVVRDNGTGMSKEVLANATAPLFTTKSNGRGTGLGLAVSSDVVRAAGGELALSSEPGAGTEVTITLPSRRGSHD